VAFDVTVLGSANLDIVLRVATIPAPGETVLAGGRQRHPGGKGLNQAVAAARAGATTAFVGSVGRDAAGDELLETMHDAGIDTAAVSRVEEPSGLALIVVQASGENTIVVDSGANATVTTLSAQGRAAVENSSVLVAQLEVPVTVVTEAAELARAAGRTLVLNAAPARQLADSLLSLVDVLVVNEHEALALTGIAVPEDAAIALARQSHEVVVTLGARGAAHVGRDGRLRRTPGLPAAAVDATAAGDAFVGVLAAALAAGGAVPEAVRRAVAAGALTVETHGAVPAIPTRDAVTERLLATPADSPSRVPAQWV